MMDINRILGIERIFEDSELEKKLNKTVMDHIRYVIPGYGCDYYLRTFNNGIDISVCKAIDGSEPGITVHFCGNSVIKLSLDHIISDTETAHLYSMRSKNSGETIPVRIVCPDVLACPKPGDIIAGQAAAFLGGTITVTDEAQGDGLIKKGNEENSILFSGRIKGLESRLFEFEDLSAEYYEMTVETSVGDVTAVALMDNMNLPESGQYITSDAVLSLDIAINHEIAGDVPFFIPAYKVYENSSFKSDDRLGFGLVPSQKNAERVLECCINKGSISRFPRACSKTVRVHFGNAESLINNSSIIRTLAPFIPSGPTGCRIMNVISGKRREIIGSNAVVYETESGNTRGIVVGSDFSGFVTDIWLVNSLEYEFGCDRELNALAKLADAMCEGKANSLYGYMSEDCIYRSEDADQIRVGRTKIIERLNWVYSRLSPANKYTYEILSSSEALETKKDLPEIYKGKWCAVEYRALKPAAVIFIQLNTKGEICNILLSRNGNYLKMFRGGGSSKPMGEPKPVSVRDLLRSRYGDENAVMAMRDDSSADSDECELCVWKEADAYISDWLKDQGYTISDTVLEDDCIGYDCRRKGADFAVYMYAFGKNPHIRPDAEYFSRLRAYPLSEGKTILIIYLKVEMTFGDDGKEKYRVGLYHNPAVSPKLWTLKEVNGNEMLLYYPNPECFDMVSRFMAAYNTQNLDLLKTLFAPDASIESVDGFGISCGFFYRDLSDRFKDYGKMKVAYVRYNEYFYSVAPYLEDKCYISISVNNTGRIKEYEEVPLDNGYRELLITNECPEYDPKNDYPLLEKLETSIDDQDRFSAILFFDNGEQRRFEFESDCKKGDPSTEEIVDIDGYCFTDKIFSSFKIVEHIGISDKYEYEDYPQRGQGIRFINGYEISTAEMYFNSYRIE